MGVGHPNSTQKCLGRGLQLLDSSSLADHDTRRERAFALWVGGQFAYQSGNRQKAWNLYTQSLALYQALDDRWATADALFALSETAQSLGELQDARRLVEKSLSIRRALGDSRGIIQSLLQAAWILQSLGAFEEAERLEREAIALTRGTKDRLTLAKALNCLGSTLAWQGRFADGLSSQEECLRLTDALGIITWSRGQPNGALGAMKAALGQYEDGRRYIEQALDLGRETGDKWSIAIGLCYLGSVALAEAKYVEARQHLQESVAVFRASGHRSVVGWSLAGLGAVESRLGQPARAREHLCEALRLSAEIRDALAPQFVLPAAAVVLADLRQAERAVEIYALASSYPFVAHSRLWEDIAGREIAALAATLPPEVVARAQERGRARERWGWSGSCSSSR